MYLHSFGYILLDDDLVKAETCDRDVIIDEWLFIIGFAICFIKYYIFSLMHGIWVTLNMPLLSLSLSLYLSLYTRAHTHTHTYIIHIIHTYICIWCKIFRPMYSVMWRSVIRFVVPDVSTHPRIPEVQHYCSDNLKPRRLKRVTEVNTATTIRIQTSRSSAPMTARSIASCSDSNVVYQDEGVTSKELSNVLNVKQISAVY
jgi:hypothetical protein